MYGGGGGGGGGEGKIRGVYGGGGGKNFNDRIEIWERGRERKE